MILLYLKFIAVSSLFILFYYSVLERQKNHHFKRYFLLGSLLLAGIIPFLEIPFGTYYVHNTTTEIAITTVNSSITEVKSTDWALILTFLYCFIAFILMIRLVYQINKLFKTKKQAKIIKYNRFDIALLTQKTTAFSFLNTIYINQKLYENQVIDDSILIHEQAHINQKHSYDVIIIEITKALFWLNPALYFYKLAICTNHEFLADEKVLESKSIKDYQLIIYNEIVNTLSPLAQTFKRHNNTKKRFIMMNTNQKRSSTRILGSILFSGAIIFAFAEKVKTPIFVENHNQKTLTQQNAKTISKKEIIIESKVESQKKLPNSFDNKIITDTLRKNNSGQLSIKNSNQVDVQAEFPGGISALRNALANEFDFSKFDNIFGKLSAKIFLQIDKDGKSRITKAESLNKNFSQEAQRCMEKVIKQTIWTPAQKNGQAVVSDYTIPFTIEFLGNGDTPPPPPPIPPIPHHASKTAKN